MTHRSTRIVIPTLKRVGTFRKRWTAGGIPLIAGLQSTLTEDREIIVADDGCGDGSRNGKINQGFSDWLQENNVTTNR